MGRWQEKLANMSKSMVTKLPEPSCVSFVSNDLSLIEKNNQLVVEFVRECCVGLIIKPQEVIDHFLAVEDEEDIINGLIPIDSLRLHIKLSIANGKPHYSGK